MSEPITVRDVVINNVAAAANKQTRAGIRRLAAAAAANAVAIEWLGRAAYQNAEAIRAAATTLQGTPASMTYGIHVGGGQ